MYARGVRPDQGYYGCRKSDCTGLSGIEAVRAAQDRNDRKRRVEDSTVLLRS